MKLLIALLLGTLIGFGLTKFFTTNKATTETTKQIKTEQHTKTDTIKWKYDDSLDAVRAAPNNHKVIYEDDNVRILQVVLDGYKEEPIHTHKWKSVMWFTKPAVPCVVYNYDLGEDNKMVIKDSITIPKMPLNIVHVSEPEAPHGIKNLSNDNGIAYRVEFKKDFK